MSVEIGITRAWLGPSRRRDSETDELREVMEPATEVVAVVLHEPGEPFTVHLCPPLAGRPDFVLDAAAFVDALRAGMVRLG